MNKECDYYDARYAAKVEDERLSDFDTCFNDKVEKLILLRGKIGNSKEPPDSK